MKNFKFLRENNDYAKNTVIPFTLHSAATMEEITKIGQSLGYNMIKTYRDTGILIWSSNTIRYDDEF